MKWVCSLFPLLDTFSLFENQSELLRRITILAASYGFLLLVSPSCIFFVTKEAKEERVLNSGLGCF